MNYWLVKTEPDECSLDDIAACGSAGMRWDGVRNYQARNFMRTMQVGDGVLIYHSSCAKIGIVGSAQIIKPAFIDPLQFDPESAYYDPRSKPEQPRWDAVQLAFTERFAKRLSLADLKAMPSFAPSPLTQKGSRLSVVPITAAQWQAVGAAAR